MSLDHRMRLEQGVNAVVDVGIISDVRQEFQFTERVYAQCVISA